MKTKQLRKLKKKFSQDAPLPLFYGQSFMDKRDYFFENFSSYQDNVCLSRFLSLVGHFL